MTHRTLVEKMGESLGLDLASKRKRQRSDYAYHLDYRTRWYTESFSILMADPNG